MGDLSSIFLMITAGSILYYFGPHPADSRFSLWRGAAAKSVPIKLLMYFAYLLPALFWVAAIFMSFFSSFVLGIIGSVIIILLWMGLSPLPSDYPGATPLQEEFGPGLGRYLSEMVDGGLITRQEPEDNRIQESAPSELHKRAA